MFSALVMRRRPEPAGGSAFEFDPFKETVERKIEIKARLFAVGDDVQTCSELITNRSRDGVVDQFGAVLGTELVEVRGCEFEPGRERVAADDCGAKWLRFHSPSF